jgi:hypothetical protein
VGQGCQGGEVFDGVESSGVEGSLKGDPMLAPALGAFPVFWVQGMEETLGNVGVLFFAFMGPMFFFRILYAHAWNGLVI